MFRPVSSCSTMERTTQTEPPKASRWKHLWLCLLGDVKFRRQRQREATEQAGDKRHVNSVSLVDRSARVLFPASFLFLNILYWLVYYTFQDDFPFPRFHGI
jgi:gamma-aminobutyric acid receptor subunit alpha